MDVDEGYRIPKLEEFVQGFEFEVKDTIREGFIDLSTGAEVFGKNKVIWSTCKVYWKAEPKWVTTESDGYKFTYNEALDNFFKPFDEKSFIEQGLVRVKIKEDE